MKKRTQALSTVALREVPVSAEIQQAAAGHATVRAFEIETPEGEFTPEELMAAVLQQGASDAVNLPWQAGVGRSREETRTSLQYLDQVIPAIEAEMGAEQEYSTGNFHWFRTKTEDTCDHGDLYIPSFPRKVFVIEATGTTEC
ncbi:hypothetical protein [Hyalangium gracile]|uniref:hypothetical protein n=1 Tax=Hyalangium gracile TaxID=394092 RepID=UPI001CCF71BF|nr:hypothetical protein [Hyalangium gracile]